MKCKSISELTEWVLMVYRAQELGIVDPRLEPLEQDNCSFTADELQRIEDWADELLAE